MDLTDRKLQILKAIIDDYIDTGIPVGSRTLSKRTDINFSSATIRNEMADLEEMGYLDKPHTSAGRTPSDLAYRLYVDRMMHLGKLSKTDIDFIRKYFDKRLDEITEVLDSAAKALSDSTSHIAVISAPQLKSVTIKHIQIVKIMDTKALVILVTDNGLVQDSMISLPPKMAQPQLDMLSNMLTDKLKNTEVKDVGGNMETFPTDTVEEHKKVMDEVYDAIRSGREKRDMFLEGAQNILKHPEYKDIDKAQQMMTLFDTKDRLFSLLDNSTDFEFTVRIGRENDMKDFSNMSVATATYKVGGKSVGSFGVIGPTRMDYSRVLSVLGYVGKSLNEILSCLVEGDE